MVTRRSTHASHKRPSGTTARSSQRRDSQRGPGQFVGSSTPTRTHRRKSVQNAGGVSLPTPNGEVLLTRRHFLFGALGVGAVAAVAGGATLVANKNASEAEGSVSPLQVPASSVTPLDTDRVVDAEAHMGVTGRFELPYGSLVWANDAEVAACLLPTEEAKPLTNVGLLFLRSGTLTTVLNRAVGQDEGFEIYDVRATSAGLIWTEANILDGLWRIYTAQLNAGTLQAPQLVDEGDAEWETPTIAATSRFAFWQVMPSLNGSHSTDDSLVKRAELGAGAAEVVYTSHGRLCTPPYALDDSVVITPRADTTGTYYQVTHMDAATGDVLDTMVLQRSMRPLEAGYGTNGFMFSFDAAYNYGDGIANLGTYTPLNAVTDGNYSESPWYCFTRNPTAAPAWCGKYFIVKSSMTVCGILLDTNEYFTLSAETGADTYGEYLASTGQRDTVVTYANIDDKPVDGAAKKYCLVRTWAPLS